MKVLVPSSITLDLGDLTGGDDPVEVIGYDPTGTIPEADRDAAVLVVWANSAENLADAAEHLGSLKLAQSLAAGPDAIVEAGFAKTVQISSGRSLHDGPVAEHTLALILALVRRLDLLRESQVARVWNDTILTEQAAPETEGLYTLDGATVTIWGFGSIATALAPMLVGLGASVAGIATTAGERSGVPVTAASDASGVHALLGRTDVLVSLVPATPATERLFDAELFASLKPTAVFVNVGRGATVDENALMDALQNGSLRAAALDVTRTEPLPQDSPLWSAPNLTLTPHIAGGRPQGAAALVVANVRAVLAGDTPENLVARD